MENANEGNSKTEEFNKLIRCHGQMLARSIRYRIANSSDAEDVFQETLLAIWLGFRRLRDPTRMQAWLVNVAQNRCRDYFRASERKEMPLEEDAFQDYANRFGLHQYRRSKTLIEVRDALNSVPAVAGETARRFYLEGLTIAEIAALSQCPPGTVKRQLFQARHAARAYLGVTSTARLTPKEKLMPAQNTIGKPSGFPMNRPEILITELFDAPFALDCQELRSWPIIPRLGEHGSSADYALTTDAPPEWKLSEVSVMQAPRPASIHSVDGVEIEACLWKPEGGWQRPGTIYARLTEDKAEFLAVHLHHAETTQVETFLDSWFIDNWGAVDRALSDQGFMLRAPDGSLTLAEGLSPEQSVGVGAGLARVEIGSKVFLCLRIFDLPGTGDLRTTEDYLTESYLTQEGRTVLVRRDFAAIAEFPVIFDEAEWLVINGSTFVHWYDSLTELVL